MKRELHTCEQCPVPAYSMVRYRTIDIRRKVADFWHRPVMASELNWSSFASTETKQALSLGRIYEYAVVDKGGDK